MRARGNTSKCGVVDLNRKHREGEEKKVKGKVYLMQKHYRKRTECRKSFRMFYPLEVCKSEYFEEGAVR